jgi:hypothetical protein
VTRVMLKMIVALRGWSLWRVKLEQRILHIRRYLRMLFLARLLHLRSILRLPRRLLRLGLSRPHLLPPKASWRGTTPLATHLLTRPVKKMRARPQPEPRGRLWYAQGLLSSRGQLPRLLPTLSPYRACRMRCLRPG